VPGAGKKEAREKTRGERSSVAFFFFVFVYVLFHNLVYVLVHNL
jgi:hypothetical protein